MQREDCKLLAVQGNYGADGISRIVGLTKTSRRDHMMLFILWLPGPTFRKQRPMTVSSEDPQTLC